MSETPSPGRPDESRDERPDKLEAEPNGQTSALDKARGIGKWITSLTTAQFQALALAFMTLFVCALAGWIVYKKDSADQADKARVDRQIEMLIRENNAREESNQKHCAQLVRESDERGDRLAKDMWSLMTTERTKERSHAAELEKERGRAMKDIQTAWVAFAVKFGDLERLIRGKDKPEEEHPIVAPPPRPAINGHGPP